MMSETKTTWILEMASVEDFSPKRLDFPGLEVRQVARPSPHYSWFLHQAVGEDFRWGGRDQWGRVEWTEWVNRPNLETWVAYLEGAPAGYSELVREADSSVRIHHFGLLPGFIGIGLGGHFLTIVLERAWELGPTKVWLSTCSHDHPHARKNYKARGFKLVEERSGPANEKRPPVIFTSGLGE